MINFFSTKIRDKTIVLKFKAATVNFCGKQTTISLMN